MKNYKQRFLNWFDRNRDEIKDFAVTSMVFGASNLLLHEMTHAVADIAQGGEFQGFGFDAGQASTYRIPFGDYRDNVTALAPSAYEGVAGSFLIKRGLRFKSGSYLGAGVGFFSDIPLSTVMGDIAKGAGYFAPLYSIGLIALGLGIEKGYEYYLHRKAEKRQKWRQ